MNQARDMRPLMAVSVKMATAGILFFDRFLSKAKGKPRLRCQRTAKRLSQRQNPIKAEDFYYERD